MTKDSQLVPAAVPMVASAVGSPLQRAASEKIFSDERRHRDERDETRRREPDACEEGGGGAKAVCGVGQEAGMLAGKDW